MSIKIIVKHVMLPNFNVAKIKCHKTTMTLQKGSRSKCGMSGRALISVIYMLTHLTLDVIAFGYNPKVFPTGKDVKLNP